jgi:hypothetical protein
MASMPLAAPPMKVIDERRNPGAGSWLRWVGWFGWAALAALAVARLAGQAADDIYITYRYAYNLAHGRGLVFNPGERVFGVSDPGVAILLAGLHRVTGLPIPDLGTAVTALAIMAIAGILLAAARAAGREAEGWLGGTLLLTSAYVWLGQGAGPLPALALLLLAARVAGGRRPWQAGALAGLAFCCRPDAALGAAALAGLLAVEAWPAGPAAAPPSAPRRLAIRLMRPAVFTAAFAAVAAIGMVAAWRYFGSALPETLAVKRHFAALKPEDFTGRAFWRPACQVFCAFDGPGGLALLALGILGLAPLFLRGGRPARLLVLFSLALAAFYTAAAVPFFLWYTLPAAVALLYGACFLAGELARRGGVGARREPQPAPARPARRVPLLVLAGLAGAVAASAPLAGYRFWSAGGSHDWRLSAYRKAGEWISSHTPPGADVAFDEVGILGYYGDRPIRDLIGLVSPLSRPYAAVGDPLGAFLAAPPELMLFQTYDRRGGTRPIRDRPWFAAAYQEVAAIPDPGAEAEIRVYRRRPGAFIPPPRSPWPRRKLVP